MADKVRIRGNVLSWGSIIVKVDGERFSGFTSLSYGDKRERTYQWGMGKHQAPRGRSRGKYTPEPVKLGGPKSTIADLRAALMARAADGISYGDVEFQIVAQYVESDETPVTVELERCVIVGNTSQEEESADPLKEEIEISCMKVIRNGGTLYDSSEGQP